jgi:DNA-binding Lrp family transcriptional regulator
VVIHHNYFTTIQDNIIKKFTLYNNYDIVHNKTQNLIIIMLVVDDGSYEINTTTTEIMNND